MAIGTEDCEPKKLDEKILIISGPSKIIDSFEEFCIGTAVDYKWQGLDILLKEVDEKYREMLWEIFGDRYPDLRNPATTPQ